MRYFLAILLPPLAVLLCGKPIQFLLNILLTLLGVDSGGGSRHPGGPRSPGR